MRAITRCPACQTQFFVTDAQLSKHNGKVRCGQCMHVFDAKAHFAETDTTPDEAVAIEQAEPVIEESYTPIPAQLDSPATPTWPSIDALLPDNDPLNHLISNPSQDEIAEIVELSATRDEIDAFTAETASTENVIAQKNKRSSQTDIDDRILIDDDDDFKDSHDTDGAQVNQLNDITKLTFVADNQAGYFDDLSKISQRDAKKSIKKPRLWLWLSGALVLLLVAIAQSVYFLRNEIAIYYPNLKPYLVQACERLSCSVNLPKQIEFIVIDDSDMQEDESYAGLMRLSSSLINKATFNQAYPNLELTLTDVDDNPILRRIFKPSEYLPSSRNIASGFSAGDEVKIKLAITTQGITVAGYRVYVTY